MPPRPDEPWAARSGGFGERYRTLFVIGKGGMGTVEVALEQGADGFERIVALKRLLPEGARDPRHKEMFLKEARLAALLAHPNVVHAYAFGELHGELFMAMEYVEGEPLSHVLHAARDDARGLAPTLVAHVLAEACEGLHAAHELHDGGAAGHPLKVVHRDVSPHNVMVAYDGRVKVLDFGVAKLDAGSNETRTGEVKGKMAYMSPEQALGEPLDRRSDLYSIGAVLFECLTGRRMWGSGTDLEVMRRLALENPPQLDGIMPGAPRELVDLHNRLVARDPQRRPATARDVAEELRSFAARSAPPGDPEAVRARMESLFGRQADGRRTLLTESLQDVAPSRVVRLQHDLCREPLLEGNRGRASTEPVLVGGPDAGTSPGVVRRRWSAGALLVAVGAVAIATTAAARRNPPPTADAMQSGRTSVAAVESQPLVHPPGPNGAGTTATEVPASTIGTEGQSRAAPPVAPASPAKEPSAAALPAPAPSAATPLALLPARLRSAPGGSAPGALSTPSASSTAPGSAPSGSVAGPAASGSPAGSARLPDVDPTPF